MSKINATQIPGLLQKAATQFGQGDLQPALAVCDHILTQFPSDFNALQLRGNIYYRLGRYAEGVEDMRAAATLQPQHAEIFNTLACLYKEMGNTQEAIAAFNQAISLKPDYTNARLNFALLYINKEQHNEAINILTELLEHDPNYAMGYLLLGESLEKLGHLNEAIESYRQASKLMLTDVRPLIKLGVGLAKLGQFTQAKQQLQSVLKQQATNYSALLNLGNIYFETREFDKAIECFQTGLKHYPDSEALLSNSGAVYEKRGDFDQAREFYCKALELNPNAAEYLTNIGRTWLEQQHIDQAMEFCQQALQKNPQFLPAYACLSHCENHRGNKEAAENYFISALNIDNRHASSWYNLGNLYQHQARYEEAITCYENVLLIDPGNADAELNLGLALLTTGDFERGWHHYFKRPRFIESDATLSPIEPGTNYQDKRIQLIRAQGIGDEILFLRYAQILKDQGAVLVYRTNKKLVELLQRSTFFAEVSGEQDVSSDADYTFLVDDLPLITGALNEKAIPKPFPLVPSTEKQQAIKDRFKDYANRPLIGITWKAGAAKADTGLGNIKILSKHFDLDDLMEIMSAHDANYIVLQRNPEQQDLQKLKTTFGDRIIDASDLNDDLEGMLALLDQIDDYIGVSNTNMHLLASLGKTARVLIPYPCDWRWMHERDESPWFPGFHIYRQDRDGRWTTAIKNLKHIEITKK